MQYIQHVSIQDLPDLLISLGRYSASLDEIQELTGRSDAAIASGLQRLRRQRRVFSPTRGLYVVIPPEFRSWGVVPADWFIDELMRHLGRRYYVALLSAAVYHGAAHQAPQVFQVMADGRVLDRAIERVRLRFYVSEHTPDTPTDMVTVYTGSIPVSSREATVVDLVREPRASGGVSNVATILTQIGEAQRLGTRHPCGAPRSGHRASHGMDGRALRLLSGSRAAASRREAGSGGAGAAESVGATAGARGLDLGDTHEHLGGTRPVIAQAYLNEWASRVPWTQQIQIEQDLVLSRLIVAIAQHELLAAELAFRGGTCLHKLHLPKQLRYSEDLDYVRRTRSGIKPYLTALREIALDAGLVEHGTNQSGQMVHIVFDAPATGAAGRIRVKIETNIAETDSFLPRIIRPYAVESRWWSGRADVSTFQLEELMSTKLRRPLPTPQGPRPVRPLACAQRPVSRRGARSRWPCALHGRSDLRFSASSRRTSLPSSRTRTSSPTSSS